MGGSGRSTAARGFRTGHGSLGSVSLGFVFQAVTGALSALVILAVVALVVLTTALHRSAVRLADAVESLRVVQQFEVDLLLHSRVHEVPGETPGITWAQIERRLEERLVAVRQYVTTARERAELAEMQRDIEALLAIRRQAERQGLSPVEVMRATRRPLEAALASAERFAATNLAQARAAEAEAARWDRLADLGGLMVTAVLVIGVMAVFVTVQRLIYHPVLAIQEAIARFGHGDTTARAPEVGPAELREIATTFNEVAATVARQREEELSFMAGVAHDLRNPLTALSVAVQTLALQQGVPSEEKLRKTVELLQRQIGRLDRIVSDLLDAARIEAGRFELRFEPRDVRALARESAELFRTVSAIHTVEVVVPDEPVVIQCDPVRVEQVLNNLLSNAIKYSPRGGPVTVTVAREGNEAVVAVTDRGIGIPPEEVPHIFDPFRRAVSAREAIPGVGLGLAVARRIVEAHGGRIEVDSTPGVGSTFRVRLPVIPPALRAGEIAGAVGLVPRPA